MAHKQFCKLDLPFLLATGFEKATVEFNDELHDETRFLAYKIRYSWPSEQ